MLPSQVEEICVPASRRRKLGSTTVLFDLVWVHKITVLTRLRGPQRPRKCCHFLIVALCATIAAAADVDRRDIVLEVPREVCGAGPSGASPRRFMDNSDQPENVPKALWTALIGEGSIVRERPAESSSNDR
jgi:hypothetical protein